MGRINLTALRVRRRALQNLDSRQTNLRPVWLDVVGDIPPAQVFIREQPQSHLLTRIRTKSLPPLSDGALPGKGHVVPTQVSVEVIHPRRAKKKSRVFQPVHIRYEEDELRKQFFGDHPWELARPRVLLETTGDDAKNADWSKGLQQPGLRIDGESVVQRQLHLLQTVPDITVSQAYDKVRKQFYDLRRQQDIQRRVASEEAEHTGAHFGPSRLQISMQIENQQYDNWEEWSRKTVVEQMQRNAAFAGDTMPTELGTEDEALNAVAANDKRVGASVFADEGARIAAQGRRISR